MRLGSASKELVGLLLLVACACAPTLAFGFLEWDDPAHLTRNPLVLSAHASVREQLTTPALGYPIPLTITSYRLEHALFGLHARVFHVTNSLLHLANVALAFVLAQSLGLSRAAAVLGALFFGLHPAAAECASWVTGRKDLLACCLGLSSLLLSMQTFRGRTAASVAAYALGLLSKPSVAPLMLLAPLLSQRAAAQESPHAASRAGERLRRLALGALPYTVILAPVMYLGLAGQAAVAANVESYAPLTRPRAAWLALGHHAALVLFAEEPTVKYQYAAWPPAFPGKADWAGVALLALATLTCWACRGHRRRAAQIGAAFAVLTYLPVSGVLFPLSRYLADSYVYLPLIGLGFGVGAGYDELMARLEGRLAAWLPLLPWAAGLTLLPLFWISSARFENDLSLWSHAWARFPHHPRICRQLTNATYKQLGGEAGLATLESCAAQFGSELLDKNRGIMLVELGRYREARQSLEAAARRAPHDPVIQKYLRALEQAEARAGPPTR